MNPRFWHILGRVIRRLTPFGITISLVIVSITPIYIPGYPGVVPLLTLTGVYHWAVYKPELLPTYAVFFVGLLQDMLHGLPIGVNATVMLLVYGIVTSQNRFFFKKSFPVIWIGFGILLAGSSFVTWIFMSVLSNAIIEPTSVYFQYVVTIGFYPALAWCLLRWQRVVLKQV